MVGAVAREILIAFLAGAAAAAFHIPFSALLIAGCAAGYLFWKKRTPGILGFFLIGSALFFGFFYFTLYRDVRVSYAVIPEKNNILFTGVVSDEPHESEKSIRFSLTLENPYRGDITVIAPLRDIRYGDMLSLRGDVIREEGGYVILFPDISITARHKGFWLKEQLLDIKRAVMYGFARALPPDNAALLSGITLGARSGFSPELKNAMVQSGTVHIVAVSGYNIGILALAVGNVAVFFLARRFAIWVAVGLILLFVGMVGTEASVVRAALMGIMGLLSEKAGRPNNQAYGIAFAAALMVFWDPSIIRNDLGFLLSFLSLLGVVYISPALRSFWRKKEDRGVLEWKENIDTTVGAQLGVLPVLLMVFGGASLTSVIANMLIIPIIPITMGFGFLLGMVNAFSPLMGFPLAKVAELLTGYELGVIHLFSRYTIPVGNFFFSPVAVMMYYAVLVMFVVWRVKRDARAIRP
ncbi:MAG: ComEC family competence protein [Patescibacteria group bacterium]|nr:ComEC family competence protein [Patescibacteria group bacterium]